MGKGGQQRMEFFRKDIGKATLVICVVICVFGIILLKNIDTGFRTTQDAVGDLTARLGRVEEQSDKSGVQAQQTPEAGAAAVGQNDGGVAGDGYIFVYFGAEWCPYCPQMEPIYEELKEEYGGRIEFLHIDIDERPDLALAYGATSVPAFALIAPDGDLVDAQIGATTKARLENLIERNL
jgi:thioredoxin 1